MWSSNLKRKAYFITASFLWSRSRMTTELLNTHYRALRALYPHALSVSPPRTQYSSAHSIRNSVRSWQPPRAQCYNARTLGIDLVRSVGVLGRGAMGILNTHFLKHSWVLLRNPRSQRLSNRNKIGFENLWESLRKLTMQLHGLQSLQAVTGQSGSGASMSVIEQSGCMHFCFSTAGEEGKMRIDTFDC